MIISYIGGDYVNSDNIGKFILELRKANNMTQKELADKLLVTSQAVSKWENGRGIPDIEMLKKLSDIFEVDINDILEGAELKKNKPNKKRIFIFIISILFIIIALLVILKFKNNNDFNFKSIASDNDSFTIKGVVAFNNKKKSIYISDVNYAGNDEAEYKNIECILYESVNNIEKKISTWGKLDSKKENLNYLSELLKEVEFNIDNYDCSCTTTACNNLHLIINALNKENKVITYNIHLQMNESCSNE